MKKRPYIKAPSPGVPPLPPYAAVTDPTKYWNQWLGSWGQTVKKYGTSATDTAWDEDDIPSTIEALKATGQNVCIYSIDTEVAWEDFLALIEEAKGTNLRIVAGMQSPTTFDSSNRWFGHQGPPDRCDPGTECIDLSGCDKWTCEREFMLKWLDAWVQAAELLSALSLSYPNLVGFTIDDFGYPSRQIPPLGFSVIDSHGMR